MTKRDKLTQGPIPNSTSGPEWARRQRVQSNKDDNYSYIVRKIHPSDSSKDKVLGQYDTPEKAHKHLDKIGRRLSDGMFDYKEEFRDPNRPGHYNVEAGSSSGHTWTIDRVGPGLKPDDYSNGNDTAFKLGPKPQGK